MYVLVAVLRQSIGRKLRDRQFRPFMLIFKSLFHSLELNTDPQLWRKKHVQFGANYQSESYFAGYAPHYSNLSVLMFVQLYECKFG